MTPPRVHARMYRAALRLYPVGFRREFEKDLVELFTNLCSDIGWRRAWLRTMVDLTCTVPRYRWEALMSSKPGVGALVAAGMATVLAVFWLVVAVGDLAGGWGDVLRHWWATLPAVAAVGSAAALLVVWRSRRRQVSAR